MKGAVKGTAPFTAPFIVVLMQKLRNESNGPSFFAQVSELAYQAALPYLQQQQTAQAPHAIYTRLSQQDILDRMKTFLN